MRLQPKMTQKRSSYIYFIFYLWLVADEALKKKRRHFHKLFTRLKNWNVQRVVHFSFIRIISLLRSETLVIPPSF